MKELIRILSSLAVLAGFVFCVYSCYDDSDILFWLHDHELRLQYLESQCAKMNTNIESLQKIVDALQNKDFVTSIAPLTENGKTIGYTISFAHSGTVTIYNGENGQDGADGARGADGSTPVLGVRQDSDGNWYWTLNGDWLLDPQGARIKANGTDGLNGKDGADGKDGVDGADGKDGQDGKDGENGKDGADGKDGQDGKDGADGKDGKDGQDGKDGADGITPQLKIEDGNWYISYDNGATWTLLGKATGEDGKDGADGKDGQNGYIGRDGRNGKDGKDGKDGQDGQDGLPGANGENGNSFFQSVTQDATNVYLTLADGTVITLPKEQTLTLTVSNSADTLEVVRQQVFNITYRVCSSVPDIHVEVISSSDIGAFVTVPLTTNNDSYYYSEGTLTFQVSDYVDMFSHVTLFVSDDRSLIVKRYSFKNRNN
ncbi:MAG: hypothetical protein IKZ91_03335 [Bacteroidales bacterium]|nr:hypothetical protein [Bacteroidales bacterium]